MIVGAGLAGAKTAEALRGEGFAGRLVLFREEPERPCERPSLSKDYLRGKSDRGRSVYTLRKVSGYTQELAVRRAPCK